MIRGNNPTLMTYGISPDVNLEITPDYDTKNLRVVFRSSSGPEVSVVASPDLVNFMARALEQAAVLFR